MRLLLLLATLLALPPCLTACGSERRVEASVPPPIQDCKDAYQCALRTKLVPAEPIEVKDIENVYRLSENVISGGEPLSRDALKRIAAMGVKTVLSVDGKTPDVETARKHGMRYVHVPIQYTGIKKSEILRIAKTFRELPKPVFVHCFHGRHRGPAAAALGRVLLDGVTREQAIAEMRQWCGTAGKYQGLYGAIATGAIPSAEETRAFKWGFDETAPVKGMRAGMVRVTRYFDNVKALQKRDFAPDPDHPDLDAVNEVSKVVDLLRAMHALDDPRGKREDYARWMVESIKSGEEMLKALKGHRAGRDGMIEAANRHFTVVKNLCSTCHHAYRNNNW